LRRLSHQIPLLTSEIRVQLRLMFADESPNPFLGQQTNLINQPPEYQAIYWLVTQHHLHSTQAAVLIQELVKEVIESFLLINAEISSPYQRPYLLINSPQQNKNLPDLPPNLINWMKGFSLRHLALMMNQDEIQLARNLYPYITNGRVILHEPDPPFDKLPKFFEELSPSTQYITELVKQELINKTEQPSSTTAKASPDISQENIATVQRLPQIAAPPTDKVQELTIPNTTNPAPERVTTATATANKVYKIVSVDDSPTILKEISRFLEDENFSVVAINEPLKAVMSIIRHKPDLILLDLNMAGIDGYELCRIIRNNPMFKNTPIIFVTGNKGLVDKVKAKLVGASGYLTKPFTRAELLKIVFMHLA
jgi:twitching motility two-component system response regulator PilG